MTSLITWAFPLRCVLGLKVPLKAGICITAANFQSTLCHWVKWFEYLPAILVSLPRASVHACHTRWVRNSDLFGGREQDLKPQAML